MKIIGLPEWYEDKSPRIESREVLMLPAARELDVPTAELTRAYVRLFDYYNDTLFRDKLREPLPHPVLNFSRARGAAAFFQRQAWMDPVSGKMLDEISLVPEFTDQDPERLCSDLVHEMAHYRDYLNGTACKGGYHGKAWFTIMERLGLPGKSIKGSKHVVTHDILPDGPFAVAYRKMPQDILLPFMTSKRKLYADGVIGAKATKEGKRAKYQCPLCANERNGQGVMRGPSGMQLLCVTHNEPLVELGW